MNLEYLRDELGKSGWQDLHAGDHLGVPFDLTGTRSFLFTPWHVLVKVLPVLDGPTLASWKATFARLNEESKSLLWGKCFLLCLVVREIALDVLSTFSDEGFGLFGVARLKGGGGKMLVASLNSQQVYAQVPWLPYDVRKFTREAVEILKKALAVSGPAEPAAVVRASPDAQQAPLSGRHPLFISYSRKDEPEKDQLVTHLRVLEKVGLVEVWSDDRIAPGAGWEAEIAHAMSRARVSVLLVSADALTSDFITGHEIPALLGRREREGLVVIPVIAKPCAWKNVDWLSRINVLPRGGGPVWGGSKDPDSTLALVAEEVATVVKHLGRA
jgi:hypothetical protein